MLSGIVLSFHITLMKTIIIDIFKIYFMHSAGSQDQHVTNQYGKHTKVLFEGRNSGIESILLL
jgi:hypothetical protein